MSFTSTNIPSCVSFYLSMYDNLYDIFIRYMFEIKTVLCFFIYIQNVKKHNKCIYYPKIKNKNKFLLCHSFSRCSPSLDLSRLVCCYEKRRRREFCFHYFNITRSTYLLFDYMSLSLLLNQ